MDTNRLELENLDMTEGALRLLHMLESTGAISVVASGMARYEIINAIARILDDMDEKMNRIEEM